MQGYIKTGRDVTEVILINLRTPRVLEIVQELRDIGLGPDDFEFAYHHAVWDGITSWEEYDHHKTTFRFTDASTATWFMLKYKK